MSHQMTAAGDSHQAWPGNVPIGAWPAGVAIAPLPNIRWHNPATSLLGVVLLANSKIVNPVVFA